ncbi:hypothetical protein GCM10009864_53140 [Streptomyces lunalinharesii]|uniref:Uncharacterized protein n=1 Tax=Streptomyces lunalinharesii TaxID=333384 RepID=A0ABN3SEN6_9ACTN
MAYRRKLPAATAPYNTPRSPCSWSVPSGSVRVRADGKAPEPKVRVRWAPSIYHPSG